MMFNLMSNHVKNQPLKFITGLILAVMLLTFSVNSDSRIYYNYQKTSSTQDDDETNELDKIKNIAYFKTLKSLLDGWDPKGKIEPTKQVKVLYSTYETAKQLALLKRKETDGIYISFQTDGNVLSSLGNDAKAIFEDFVSQTSLPNRTNILHVHFSNSNEIWHSDVMSIFMLFKNLKLNKQTALLISSDSQHNIDTIITPPYKSTDDSDLFTKISSLVKLPKMSPSERKELVKQLTAGFTFAKDMSIDQVNMILHGHSFDQIYDFISELKKTAKNKKIDVAAVTSTQDALDLPPVYTQPEVITSKSTSTSNNSSNSNLATANTPSNIDGFDFFPKNTIKARFSDVAGLADAKKSLNIFVEYLKNTKQFNDIGATMPKGIILYGPPGTGKTHLAKAFAGESGLNFVSASGSQFLQGYVGEGAKTVRKVFALARSKKPCVLFIDEFDSIATSRQAPNSKTLEYVNQLLVELDGVNDEANEGLIIIAATNRLDEIDTAVTRPGRFDRHIYLGVPNNEERLELMNLLSTKYKVDPNLDISKLSNALQGWEPASINALFNKGAIEAVLAKKSEIDEASFEHARSQILQDKRDLLEQPQDMKSKFEVVLPEDVKITFADVGGLSEAKEELKDILYFMKHEEALEKAGVSAPTGAILYGPPGTGKTMLARALAGEAGVSFISLSATELMGMYIGHSAPIVRELFKLARAISPTIIFIDEFDAIVQDRQSTGQNGVINQEIVNQLLAELDGIKEDKNSQLFIVAATNLLDSIDPAIIRPGRFDRHIEIAYPDNKGRAEISEILFKKYQVHPSVKPQDIADMTTGWSPAQIKQLFNEATITMVKADEKALTLRMFAETKDRILIGSKSIEVVDEEELTLTAYHEAGHALIAYLLPESNRTVEKINIMARGHTLGVTIYQPTKESFSHSYQTLLANISVSLGGRAAEEILRGYEGITSGISSDLDRASQIAFELVTKIGYSQDRGLATYQGNMTINATSPEIRLEIKKLLDTEYAKTKQLLLDNKDKLDRVVKALLEKQSLTKDEFEAIVSKQ